MLPSEHNDYFREMTILDVTAGVTAIPVVGSVPTIDPDSRGDVLENSSLAHSDFKDCASYMRWAPSVFSER